MGKVGYFKTVYVPVKPGESMLDTYIHSPTTFKSSQVGTSHSTPSFSWLVGRSKMHLWPPLQPSDVSLGLPRNEGPHWGWVTQG